MDVSVGYELSVRLIEVELVLDGTIQIDTVRPPITAIMQSQKCSASFVLEGVDANHGADLYLTNHSFSVPGNIFYDYVATTYLGDVIDFPSGHFEQPSTYWYWRGPPDLHQVNYHSTETVSGIVAVNSAEGFLVAASSDKDVEVYRPYYEFESESGYNTWDWFPAPSFPVRVRGGDLAAGINGQLFYGSVTVQSYFVQGTDSGYWNFTQLYKGFRDAAPYYYSHTEFLLDSVFPYAGSFGSLGGYTSDSPAQIVVNNPGWQFVIDDEFLMYQLWMAPGADSEFIPLAYIHWVWVAGNTGYFPLTPSGYIAVVSADDESIHPEWTDSFLP